MRVEVIHAGGRYTERVIANLQKMNAGQVDGYQVTNALPPVLDDAAEFLPPQLGQGEVIIAINLHPELLLEIPHKVAGGPTKALIAPIEDPGWVPRGLQRQVTQACANKGIETAFPKPFCSLEPSTPAIAAFSQAFKVGRHKLTFRLEHGLIMEVEVHRGSPCGLTDFVAAKLIGLPAESSLPQKAGQLHHAYPCLASMRMDQETGDTVMHASLALIHDAAREALEQACKETGEV